MYKLYIKLVALVCLVSSFHHANALLHDIFEVVDLSNLDLANYEFFKNLPSQNPKTAAQANLFIEHFQKKKAVLDYLDNLFFGNSPFARETEIVFNPHFGRAWRPYFERKYGKRGERLIAVLGRGHTLQQLRTYGAIPKEFGRIYYPS
ncbi:uncharacterized protein LOC119681461 [Teleopsis dalmanni]|uniref:uncharacterized protein LOC119681461 n=1 Tax=Teleopsis dalmanni TaxID=139649 RepID=UPI0018CDA57C|nr:uncharacterized protein LOC119681461 [Teleopsis dalmanni]